MAELMYGSGLRLMELLRLRVQDLDLDRHRLQVRGGKGDKDRATVLPGALAHKSRSPGDIDAAALKPLEASHLAPAVKGPPSPRRCHPHASPLSA
ncbi:MAG: tyrosine-type recombinase/integrase [Opitutaceae bacterium]|nr:tyrosine-type recombinase/integrase [Opitutaceae bacterium]